MFSIKIENHFIRSLGHVVLGTPFFEDVNEFI